MKLAVAALLATSAAAFQAPTMTFSLGRKSKTGKKPTKKNAPAPVSWL